MKKIISLLILVLIGVMNLSASDKSIFWLGADISGTTELEARGVQLYNAAVEPVKYPTYEGTGPERHSLTCVGESKRRIFK